MFTEILSKALNISEKIEGYITKIGKGLAEDYNCDMGDIDVNIVFKNSKPVLYFYIKRKFVKRLTSQEIETYCLK